MVEKENIIQIKSYNFALKIITLSKTLDENRQFILSRQLLKSGTSIGANVEEAIGGCSKKEFAVKIQIAYKEARETKYWLRLLKDSKLINPNIIDNYLQDIDEILKIIAKIHKTTRSNLEK